VSFGLQAGRGGVRLEKGQTKRGLAAPRDLLFIAIELVLGYRVRCRLFVCPAAVQQSRAGRVSNDERGAFSFQAAAFF
jgi:hypothetical protein